MLIKRTEPAERAYSNEVVAPRLGDDVAVIDEPPHEVKVDLLGRARASCSRSTGPSHWPRHD